MLYRASDCESSVSGSVQAGSVECCSPGNKVVDPFHIMVRCVLLTATIVHAGIKKSV